MMEWIRKWMLAVVVPTALLVACPAAFAQDAYDYGYGGFEQDESTQIQNLLQRIEMQDARIRDLEGQRLQSQPQMLPAVSTDTVRTFNDRISALEASTRSILDDEEDEGDGWEDAENGWTSKWGGRIMGDLVLISNQDAANVALVGDLQNYFEFRRLRIFTSGKGYGVYDYKFQVDFEPETGLVDDPAVSIKDMYVGIHEVPYLGYVRFGHFKEPFSLEELTSSKYITFMERSLPNIFTKGRQVGMAMYQSNDDETATFAAGLFINPDIEAAKEAVADNICVDIPFRVTYLPWYANEGRHMAHVGAGYLYQDDNNNLVRYRARPEVHEGPRFVDTGNFGASESNTFNVEGAWVGGPWSVQSEFFFVNTNGAGITSNNDFWGAYVYGSYFFTGEHRRYKKSAGAFDRVKPLENFWVVDTGNGTCAGWGALEGTIRYSYLDVDDDDPTLAITRGELADLTIGLNWYWNAHTRWMFNYIHAYGDVFAGGIGQNNAEMFAMRLQVDF